MQKPAIDAIGCMDDDEYPSAFEQYVSDAIVALMKHLNNAGVREQVDASIHPMLDSIVPKFKLVSLDFTNTMYGLPILTRSPIAALAVHLESIPTALKEARTFESAMYLASLTNE